VDVVLTGESIDITDFLSRTVGLNLPITLSNPFRPKLDTRFFAHEATPQRFEYEPLRSSTFNLPDVGGPFIVHSINALLVLACIDAKSNDRLFPECLCSLETV
jgi:hypothetical protein